MGDRSGDIQFHFLAAAGNGPFYPFQVGDQGPVFYPRFLFNALEYSICIGHLRD